MDHLVKETIQTQFKSLKDFTKFFDECLIVRSKGVTAEGNELYEQKIH